MLLHQILHYIQLIKKNISILRIHYNTPKTEIAPIIDDFFENVENNYYTMQFTSKTYIQKKIKTININKTFIVPKMCAII